MKFKIGDIVTGKETNDYNITTDLAVMEVMEVLDDKEIKVKILEHKEIKGEIGKTYIVGANGFKLYKSPQEITINRVENKVIAHNTITDKRAVAKCHPDDKFDFFTGAKLALERLEKECKPKLYYVKFTKDNVGGYLNIHKNGKVVVTTKYQLDCYKTQFTLEEIEAINPHYLPFAVEVEL